MDTPAFTPRGWHEVFWAPSRLLYTTCRSCRRLLMLTSGATSRCFDCRAKRDEKRRIERNKRKGEKMRAGVAVPLSEAVQPQGGMHPVGPAS